MAPGPGTAGRRGRWAAVAFAAAMLVLVAAGGSRAAGTFGLDEVAARARKLAAQDYEDDRGRVPKWLLEIDYDQWRSIRFRPERSLWQEGGSPFVVQFFHPGLFYDRVVAVNVVDAQGVHRVDFSPSQFDYGSNEFASRVPQDLGYAGFRLHYPIKTPTYRDEVLVFLGASYFRGVGRRQVFGLSARGLAVDTALSSGEEFPYFKEFWLVRPAAGAKAMTVYALLDSRSLAGAYRFAVYPGEQTVVEVEARLFRRAEGKKLGLAPLTSMFFFGENSVRSTEDYRPEVHDSDGLLLADGDGEWIWRPLDNPATLQVSGFQMVNPKGFGLVQRDRDFDHYQDLEARPDLRPSAWVVPDGDWGKGRVELIEIPTHADTNDNIAAFWVPAAEPPLGEPIAFSYKLYWYDEDRNRPPGGRALATRRDHGTLPDAVRFVVDFTGKRLAAVRPDTVVRGVVTVGAAGELLEQQVHKNPVTDDWRLVFQVHPKGDDPVELRAFLALGDEVLTETWAYRLLP